jgi:hypothetical protein
MGSQSEKIILNGAPSQYDRALEALAFDHAPVDGRRFSELLDFPIKFGALIKFYGLDDQADGDWVGFFASDPTMLLAAIDSADLGAIEREFARLERLTFNAHVFEVKFELLCAIFTFIQSLARRFNDALAVLEPLPSGEVGQQLWDLLVNLIETSLRAELQRLKDYAEGAALPNALRRPIPLDSSGFLPVWELHEDCPDGSIYSGRSGARKIDHALPYLVPIFAAFRNGIADLVRFARANLPASLEADDHKPQIGLFIAFARLFQTAQATINQTSERYRRFYYEDVLRGKPAGPVGDQLYLTFMLAAEEGVSSTAVPGGTLFAAGEDAAGQEILYASDRTLTVSAAALEQTRTLRVVCGPLAFEPASSPPGEVGPEVVRCVLGAEIALAEAAAKSISWPTFGAPQDGSPVAAMAPATLGFAVASPYLLLTGGTRFVQLAIGYSEDFQDTLYPLLDELSGIVGLDAATIFRLILEGAFAIEASTESGWFDVTPYTAYVPGRTDPGFVICFTLPPAAPAVTGYDPASSDAVPEPDTASGPNPAPGVPTLKFNLRQEPVALVPRTEDSGTAVSLYPLSLLAGMPLETFEIAVDVEELSGMQLQNTDGPVDTSSPFPLLGSPTVVGSYLDIRHDELFAKRIDTLRLAIAWFNLPQNSDGFKGYYRDYVIGPDGTLQPALFDNRVFRVAIDVRNPGYWALANSPYTSPDLSPPELPAGSPPGTDIGDNGNLCLFRTQPYCDATEPDVPICPGTAFAFGPWAIVDYTLPPYYRPADSALRISLTAPSYAFGDDLYAPNVLHAVIADLPDPGTCQHTCEVKCAVLKNAAAAINACIETCSLQPDDTFRQCIETGLTECVDQILLDAVECLWDCFVASSGGLDALRRTRLAASFDEARAAAPGERGPRLRQWIEDARSVPGIDLNCLNKCFSLLLAVACIEICQDTCVPGSPDIYRGCIVSGLQACATRLEEAYAQCFQQCVDACMKPADTLKYPNTPWLPTAQSVTVGYSANCVLFEPGGAGGQFFHLLPFDGWRAEDGATTLLPRFDEGALYLGFGGLTSQQNLTLLFQMGGSGDEGACGGLPAVTWELLQGNDWQRLEGTQVATDGTNGLANSGILGLNLPQFLAGASTVLPGERHWLRAGVRHGAAHFPATVGIYPNAVPARRQDVAAGGETLRRPLLPHSITGSVEQLPLVAAVDQPIESFGGRPPETLQGFEIRFGERLRHKNRASLGWDYERLVLEQFPTVWKVQALPARAARYGDAPGHVLVVVVPGPDSREVLDPTAPAASGDLLNAIRVQLESLASPFVRLNVVNPVYVRIQVTAVVQFVDGEDAGAAIARLNGELVRYLSPWYYDAARAALGGRYVADDEISTFIETRPYVEELLAFTACQLAPAGEPDWCFLTSAQQHQITNAAPPGRAGTLARR